MKKLLFSFVLMLTSMLMFAQNTNEAKLISKSEAMQATQEGNIFVGVNTTGFGFTNVDGVTNTNVGINVGAFAKQNFAIVANVGYGAVTSKEFNTNDWYYGAGLRYYIVNAVPVQVDWKGSVGNNYHPTTSYIGVEGGYAWFISKRFSVEPKLRYDISTRDEYKNVFSGTIGFNTFF